MRTDFIFVNYLEELHKWYHTIHTDKSWANIPTITNIEENLGLVFVPEPFELAKDSVGNVCMANSIEVRNEYKDTFTPTDLLDYSYAVLHSAKYRDAHKEFKKSDFSLLPHPAEPQAFWELVRSGRELRQSHL